MRPMTILQRVHAMAAVAMVVLLLPAATPAQSPPRQSEAPIPPTATALAGVPRVKIENSEEGTTRTLLDPAQAAANRLAVRVSQNRLYWSSRDDRSLSLTSSNGAFYLSPTDPGSYIRFWRVNDRLTYMEHIDLGPRSVTYWGELKVVLGP